MKQTLRVRTRARTEVVDLTAQVRQVVGESGIREGWCVVYVPHTTAAVTINENADPNVMQDVLATLEELVPWQAPHYRHREGNSAAHIKASLLGPSEILLVEGGQLQLGTWQGIQFCEFDGPRTRQVWVQVVGKEERDENRPAG
ncbi:MAG TPA: YjbQ family protein [Piscirickettsiaceae bacterium]|nr:YjbQ family protein [Piscirickettsiaceae bacterium]